MGKPVLNCTFSGINTPGNFTNIKYVRNCMLFFFILPVKTRILHFENIQARRHCSTAALVFAVLCVYDFMTNINNAHCGISNDLN